MPEPPRSERQSDEDHRIGGLDPLDRSTPRTGTCTPAGALSPEPDVKDFAALTDEIKMK